MLHCPWRSARHTPSQERPRAAHLAPEGKVPKRPAPHEYATFQDRRSEARDRPPKTKEHPCRITTPRPLSESG